MDEKMKYYILFNKNTAAELTAQFQGAKNTIQILTNYYSRAVSTYTVFIILTHYHPANNYRLQPTSCYLVQPNRYYLLPTTLEPNSYTTLYNTGIPPTTNDHDTICIQYYYVLCIQYYYLLCIQYFYYYVYSTTTMYTVLLPTMYTVLLLCIQYYYYYYY